LVLLVLIGVLALAVRWLGGGPLTASEPVPDRPALVAVSNGDGYVVRPGDTIWSLARRVQPEGDVRPLVHALSAARHGAPLRAGEHIILPE
jgi:hypothetical protein